MFFLNRLLGLTRSPDAIRGGESSPAEFSKAYESLEGFNVAAAISNKLANIVCSEAEIEFAANDGGGEPSLALADMTERFRADLRNVTARTFGTGGVLLRPYVCDGEVYIDAVAQERFFPLERRGGGVGKAGFIADVYGDYTRIELHTLLDGGGCSIENKAYEGEREAPLRAVERWAGIEPKTVIEGVTRPLYAHLKCPVDARRGDSGFLEGVYGVPVTHGQQWLIKTINELLMEIPLEYRNKRAFIGAEDLLFDSKDRLPESGVYKLLRANGGESRSFWEVFSPEIRHTSYFEGLNYLFGLLEKAVSVNKGILTDLDSTDATATAIKRSMFDTYNLVDAMRRNIERTARELVCAGAALLGAESGEGVSADGCLRFNWSYSLLEDSTETFKQLLDGYDKGIVSKDEVRRFLF